MSVRRKVLAATVTVVCGLSLAACGQQIAAHVEAADSVHSALTSAVSHPSTRLVITGQNLPGQAAILDGSFSIVITTSGGRAGQGSSTASRAVDLSIYHESTNLVDLRVVGPSAYFRLDLKDLAAFGGSGDFSRISAEMDALARRRGLGFVHDVLVGKWVGISTGTLLAFEHKLTGELGGATTPSVNLPKARHLRTLILSSLAQSVRAWLSIHQVGANEYSLELPIRSFVRSFVSGVYKPLVDYLNEPLLSGVAVAQEVGKLVDKIPAGLTGHAYLWVKNGSMSRLQLFIPDSSASLFITVSYPGTRVQAPKGATMLTVKSLTDLMGMTGVGGLGSSTTSSVFQAS